ncbi:MaoC/PaaZ C-terminal domain-containing protein [Alteromonas oceanisediminis]|uniref:MaoC/PaaZ C-terminal domain-containing protein n=1 Tax=Alteromonas oceanisediminis TaxID=2836180 RepID=UPI001BDB0F44|nr:MaoC/PaaZ C-terminal domain-containing protein [Alteromonas oceanisediminis]MBT0585962.1 hypothetical protein [Alteromonas oceanisediminis]
MSQVWGLVRAALKRGNKTQLNDWFSRGAPIAFPALTSMKQVKASMFQKQLVAFNRLHTWSRDELHPCFPQLLGLPQHINALLDPRSPFPLVGLVHLRNSLSTFAPIDNDDLTICCQLGGVSLHRKGITVELALSITQGATLCQTTRSTYLYRIDSTSSQQDEADKSTRSQAQKFTQSCDDQVLRFDSGAGRRYARVSGDFNPIHLYAWSAKLLGFKAAIAHGMHVLAKTLSAIDQQTPFGQSSFVVNNSFNNPATLPCDLALKAAPSAQGFPVGCAFDVVNTQVTARKQLVLSGSVQPLQAEGDDDFSSLGAAPMPE